MDPSAKNLAARKTEMRKAMRALRRGAERTLSADALRAAAARVRAASGLAAHHRLACYCPVGSEFPALTLAELLGHERLALPVTPGPAALPGDALAFRVYAPGDWLEPDALGVPAPGPEAPETRPDIVLVPLLAFDAAGGRLGQGGGWYDRTLARLRAQGTVCAIGLAFEFQRIEAVPMEPGDERLDWIVTEKAAYDARKAAGGEQD